MYALPSYLSDGGYDAFGWDPVHNPNGKKEKASIVNLGFVLNVIENVLERVKVVQDAFSYAEKLLVVATLLKANANVERAVPYSDGVLTSRNTFQKFFEQDEIQQFIEDALNHSAIAVAPGVFFVFKDPVELQFFLQKRYQRDTKLSTGRKFRLTGVQKKRIHENELFSKHKALIDRFWDKIIELGRIAYSRKD